VWRGISGGVISFDCIVVVGVTDSGEVIGVMMVGLMGGLGASES
jgi:hypothetical protein